MTLLKNFFNWHKAISNRIFYPSKGRSFLNLCTGREKWTLFRIPFLSFLYLHDFKAPFVYRENKPEPRRLTFIPFGLGFVENVIEWQKETSLDFNVALLKKKFINRNFERRDIFVTKKLGSLIVPIPLLLLRTEYSA